MQKAGSARLAAPHTSKKLAISAVKYADSTKTAWETIEEAHIPYGDLLVYPKDWDRIAKRTEPRCNRQVQSRRNLEV